MDIRVGPSFALSVLIVIAAAITFHKSVPAPATERLSRPSDPPRPATQARVLPPVEKAAKPPETAQTKPAPTSNAVARQEPPVFPVEKPRVIRPEAGSAGPIRPRTAFTRVEVGETLADVSLRVYQANDPAVVHDFWLANRDQLKTPETRLEAGMVLRTP